MGKEGMLILKEIVGTPGRIRTCDLLLRRQPLYPSELQAHATDNKLLNQNSGSSISASCGGFCVDSSSVS